jgi:hypothetical protein
MDEIFLILLEYWSRIHVRRVIPLQVQVTVCLCRCLSCGRDGAGRGGAGRGSKYVFKMAAMLFLLENSEIFMTKCNCKRNTVTGVPTVLQLKQLCRLQHFIYSYLRPLFSVWNPKQWLQLMAMPSCLLHHYDLQFKNRPSARPQSQLTWERHCGNYRADTLVKLSYTNGGNRQLLVLRYLDAFAV